jgi:hypothetical protein
MSKKEKMKDYYNLNWEGAGCRDSRQGVCTSNGYSNWSQSDFNEDARGGQQNLDNFKGLQRFCDICDNMSAGGRKKSKRKHSKKRVSKRRKSKKRKHTKHTKQRRR